MPRAQFQPSIAYLDLARLRLEAAWRHELGVSAYEMAALLHLQGGALVIGDLGKRLALTSGAMTGLIGRLVQSGFVERINDPDDGRRVHLHLTPQAVTRLARVQRPYLDGLADVERGLGAEDAARLARAIDDVADLATNLGERR